MTPPQESDSDRVAVGQIWRHAETGLRIRIVQVPGGRKRTYRFEYVAPRPGGNGRPYRGTRKLRTVSVLFRRYELEPES